MVLPKTELAMLFTRRATDPELLDDFGLGGETLTRNLREIDFINKYLGGDAITLAAVRQVLGSYPKGQTIHIVDLGCGSGEMLRLVARYGRRRGFRMLLTGIDANAAAVAFAQSLSQDYPEITYLQADVTTETAWQNHYHIAIGTLFFHHFADEALHTLFGRIRQHAEVLVVNDLHRHALAYYGIAWLTRWFSRSRLTKNDAKLSVLRGFRAAELAAALRQGGWQPAFFGWKWAFRWLVVAKPA